MRKRAASIFLCLALLLQLAPEFTIRVSAAAGAVTYYRETPPAGIFNAINGSNNDFYNTYTSMFTDFNLISKFGLNYTSIIKTNGSYEWNWQWGATVDTVWKIANSGGLCINTSGTFTNDWHTHYAGFLGSDSQKVLSYTSVQLYAANDLLQNNSGLRFSSSSDPSHRLGIGKWSAIGNARNFTLVTYEPDITYNKTSTCSCHTGSVTRMAVALKDTQGPTIKSVTATQYTAKPGDTVTINVQYNEPIRFADDSAYHDDATIKLRLDNHDATFYRTATLTGLNDDTLTFSFTVPATDNTTDKLKEYSISTLDLSSLIQETPLKLVTSGNTGFTSVTNFSGDGYSTAKALVTDLAGNPISQSSYTTPTLRVDGVNPTVKSVTQQAVTNNANVKAALKKTDSTDKDYTDYSDTHLGVGDSVTFTANFSELLNLTAGAYKTATATTNLKRSGSTNYVTVSSATLATVPATTTDAAYSALTFAPLAIESGMTCDDASGNIKITGITFTDAVTDVCGNKYDGTKALSSENTNTKILDVTGPATTTGISASSSNKYTPTRTTYDIYFPFTIAGDTNDLASINGSFILASSDGAGSGSAFEYAVTTSAAEPASWTGGTIGSPCTFEQFERMQYLHIRTKDGVTYDLDDPNLTFKPEDYAGNIGSTTFQLDWQKDTVAPTAAAGTPTRALTPSATREGTLTVPVTVTDHSGLKSIQYAWGGTTAPTSWTDSGETLTSSSTTVTANAEATVSGTNFSQHLWVQATDQHDNILTQDLGVFDYDLSQVAYTLTPNTNYAKQASLVLGSLGTGGAMAVLLKIPGDTNTDNYYVHYTTEEGNIFTQGTYMDNIWVYLSVVKNPITGIYTFTQQTPTDDVKNTFVSIMDYDYTGKFAIKTIVGLTSAFETTTYTTASSKTTAPTTAGINQYPVSSSDMTLRVTNNSSKVYSAKFTLPDSYSRTLGINGEFSPSDSTTYLPSTLSGVPVKIEITNNVDSSLGISEINFNTSHLYVYLNGDYSNYVMAVSLNNATITGNSITVNLPEADYASGAYSFEIALDRPNGTDALYDTIQNVAGNTSNYYVIDASAPGTAVIAGALIYNDDLSNYGTNGYVLYAPVGTSKTLYYPASHNSQPSYGQRMTFTLEGQTNVGATSIYNACYGGQRAVRAWNTTAKETEDSTSASWKIFKDNAFVLDSESKSYPLKADYIITYVSDANGAASAAAGTLPLIANQDNTIAVQTMSDNGKVSQVFYYTVHPDSTQVTGTFSTTQDTSTDHVFSSGELVFTPTTGQALTGTKLYLCAGSGLASRTEMTQELDGTYRCALPTGVNVTANYRVCAIDQYDNYTLWDNNNSALGVLNNLDTAKLLDSGVPAVTAGTATVNTDGTYTATYTVTDDTNLDAKLLTLQLGFDDTYSSLLGLPAGSTYTISLAKGSSWSLPAGESNAFGITSVRVDGVDNDVNHTQTTVTVTGVAKYDTTKTGSDTYSITPSLIVADIFGNTSKAISDNSITVTNTMPAAKTDWALVDVRTATYRADMGLKVNFNQPVTIGKSWICQSPSACSVSKTDEIPITDDGDHTIEFYDVFGTLWQQDVTMENVFGSYGFTLTFSTTADTTDPVTVTATGKLTDKAYSYLSIYKSDLTTMLNPMAYEPSYKTTANDTIVIKHYQNDHTANVDDYTVVHIANIIDGAPTARLHYSFEDTAMVYNGDDPLPTSTTGKVTVSYTTERNVTPTDAATFTFDSSTAKTHTFHYTDDFGNEGSVTAYLTGVTFTGKYIPPADTNPPQLSVSIEAERSGSYVPAENFGVYGTSVNDGSQTNTIGAALTNIGYAQAYNFVITATDASDCKLVVLNTAPTGATMNYATASATITGVNVSGRNIYVDKTIASDFAVAVVDSAGNYSTFTIPKASLKFDTESPTLAVEWVNKTLYDRIAYLTISDKSNDGTDTSSTVTVTAPDFSIATDKEHNGKYYYEFTTNETKQVILTDSVGNTTTQSVGVTDLDLTPPTLTVEWTPCYVSSGTRNTASPTAGPVNRDITAKIKSDKPIKSVDVVYLIASSQTPPKPLDKWDGDAKDQPSYVLSDTDKTMVTVTFPASDVILLVTVTAANGQSNYTYLDLEPGVIDKTTLTVDSSPQEITRTGYIVPYAKTITLTPSKDAYSTDGTGKVDESGNPTVYNASNPLKVKVYSNGTYRYHFVDKAGNTAIATVVVTDIDSEAPTITTDPADTSELPSTISTTSVTVKLNEAGTIVQGETKTEAVLDTASGKYQATLTFTENGSYVVAAYDLAGNMSFARISIGNIDHDAPTITFDTPTVKLVQGSTDADLTALLVNGYTPSDGKNQLPANAVSYDSSKVTLGTPGLYSVAYAITDAAGNETKATRWVQVYSKDLPLVKIDGERADPDGLIMLKSAGSHALTVANLKTASEPYKVYLRKGIWSAGQMKGAATLSLGSSGSFILDSTGYYTLYILTQSRQTFRVLLYVEK